MVLSVGDSLYKIYVRYMNGDLKDITKEQIEFFDRYNKIKLQGFTFMQYKEFECLIKYDNDRD